MCKWHIAGEPYASQHTTLYNSGVREEREKGKGRGIAERGFSPSPRLRLRTPPFFAPATQANPWLTIQL